MFPSFKDFVKPVNDLMDFEEGSKMTVKRMTASGVKIEQETELSTGLATKVKGVVKDKQFGELSVEGTTAGQFTTKMKMNKCVDDCVFTLEHAVGPKSKNMHTGAFSTVFSQKQFASTLKLGVLEGTSATSGSFETSVVGGQDGVVAAVQLKGAIFPEQKLKDYDAAVSYKLDDTFGAVTTEQKFSKINAFLMHNCCASTRFGVKASRTAGKKEKDKDGKEVEVPAVLAVSAVVEHCLDDETTAKFGINDSRVVTSSIEHKLKSGMGLTLAGSFKPTWRNCAATNVALALSFGDC
jgi:hypothetical protein